MSDDKKTFDSSHLQNIHTSQAHELQDWSKKYGVSFDQLERVIKDPWSVAKDIEDFLKKRNKNVH